MNVTPPAADIPSGTGFFSGGFFLDRETGWVPYTTSLAGTDSVTGLIASKHSVNDVARARHVA